jgi:hypothetical protein
MEITISDPAATIATAAAQVCVAVMNYSGQVRSTESSAAREEEDHIRFQAYWDWRAVLKTLKIVGEPLPWPPPAQPPAVQKFDDGGAK